MPQGWVVYDMREENLANAKFFLDFGNALMYVERMPEPEHYEIRLLNIDHKRRIDLAALHRYLTKNN